jgi:hypothetical protein
MKPVPRKKVDEENSISDLKKENIGKTQYKKYPKNCFIPYLQGCRSKNPPKRQNATIKRLTLYVDT